MAAHTAGNGDRRNINPIQTARAVALLTDHFDKANSEYQLGWSDARIAADVGCEPGAVARIRINFFGKLIERSAKTDVAAELADLRAWAAPKSELDKLRAEVAELKRRLGDA